jgi:hypothetical protein
MSIDSKWFFMPILLICFTFPALNAKENEEDSAGRALVIWKDVTIDEKIEYETVVVMTGNVEFYGKTERLVVIDGKVRLKAGSAVTSKLILLGGSVEQAQGSSIPEKIESPSMPWLSKMKEKFEKWTKNKEGEEGETAEENFFSPQTFFPWKDYLWLPLSIAIPLGLIVILILGALLFFTIAPQLSRNATETLREFPFPSLAWGALAYLSILPVLVLLALSIVGIPLIPVFVFLMLIFFLAGLFASSQNLGHLALQWTRTQSRMLQTFIGLLILWGLQLVPFVGHFFVFFILIAGTGAVLKSIFGTRMVSWGPRSPSGPVVYDL